MPKDLDWLQRLFSEKTEPPVIRGLNLALKLADPAKLPLMLWDVVAAQPKIDLAMRELSFLHFARFVPSWDGTALMVITEFDGPLEDYVLDFAIVIGDVFDTLLRYVENPPPLPVREHPSEFLRFVRLWNRVPYGPRRADGSPSLLPGRFDFPIYQAYPDKTVLDIHPHRDPDRLLPPVIDGPAAVVDLDDVQGNILKGYGAPHARHFFLRVRDGAAARPWLAHEFAAPDGGYPWKGLTSAAPWPLKPVQAGQRGTKPLKPELAANIGFTWRGLQMLMPWRQDDLDEFPTAFRQGAALRAEDNGDTDHSAPEHWRFGNDKDVKLQVHMVISLYGFDDDDHALQRACLRLRNDCKVNGLEVLHEQGTDLRPHDWQRYAPLGPDEDEGKKPDWLGREQFGFRDSITQPRISGLAAANDKPDMQPSASPGEFLLGQDYASIYGGSSLRGLAPDLAQNGSFGVLRLIEQHVDAFERTVNQAAADTGEAPDFIKAKLMGRWPGGEPLTPVSHVNSQSNDFDYAPSWEHPAILDDHEGKFCPLGAHIRRTNPRSSRVAGLRHSRRLLRRGMLAQWSDEVRDDKTGKVTAMQRKHGLMGLFFCANLERQFEFIQRHWIQGSADSRLRGTQDPIAGIRSKPVRFDLGPGAGNHVIEVPPLVSTRGCLYLFYPGLRMLDSLLPGPEKAEPAMARKARQPLRDALARTPRQLLLVALNKLVDAASDSDQLDKWRPKLEEWVPQLLPRRFEGPAKYAEGTRIGQEPKAHWPFKAGKSSFIAEPQKSLQATGKQLPKLIWVSGHRAYWAIDRDLVRSMLETPQDFRQAPSTALLRGIIRQDGERHGVVARAVGQAFSIAMAPMATYLDDALVDVLPRLWQLDQFDFVREVAEPVPRRVFWRFFGLPADEVATCDALAQTMMRYYNLPDGAWEAGRKTYADATVRLSGHLGRALARAWIAELRPGQHSPYDGTLIGEIARQTKVDLSELPMGSVIPPPLYRMHFPRHEERPLAAMEAVAVLVQMVLAGYMSTQFLLGSAMLNFLRPDSRSRTGATSWAQLAALHGQPRTDGLKLALAEALRFDPPVAIVERYTASKRDNFEGFALPKDAPVHAVIAVANRQGRTLDQFHWDRPRNRHFSLGHGMHECMGAALQDQISQKVFEVLLDEFPALALCRPDATPAWIENIYFRGLTTLPVTRSWT
ncbi:MAG TPA: hypothetical protein VGE36_22270 [Roseateles sp.]